MTGAELKSFSGSTTIINIDCKNAFESSIMELPGGMRAIGWSNVFVGVLDDGSMLVGFPLVVLNLWIKGA